MVHPVAAIYLPMMPRFWAYCNSVILSSKPPRCKHFLPFLPMGWQVKCIRKSYKGSGLARDTPLPSAHCVRIHLPQGDGFWQCRKVARHHESRPLGEGGIAVGDDGRGAPAQAACANLFPRFPRALYLSAPGNVLYYKNKKSVRFLRPAQKALRTTR